jgi:ABC-type transport system involved in multi-copper enzyme maturation permease subunit
VSAPTTAGPSAGPGLAAAVRAERLKLTSLPGTWVAVALFAGLSLAYGTANAVLVQGSAAGTDPMTLSNAGATAGLRSLGLTVLMVLAAVAATGEHSTGTVLTSHLGSPRRWPVLAAKALLLAGTAAVAALVVAVLAVAVGGLVTDPVRQDGLGLTAPGAAGTLGALAATSALLTLLALAVGSLVRSSTVAVAVVVLWPAVVESLLVQLPGGEVLAGWMPFANADLAMTGSTGAEVPWGQAGALAYLAVLAAAALAAAAAVAVRRDDRAG